MISKYSVKKPYTVLVGILLIIVLGVVSVTRMSADLLPSMEFPYAIIITTYPGASPEEVETAVTAPVEGAMATVSNIKSITSVSSDNMSMVICEYEQTANMDSVSLEMRENLDLITPYWPDSIGSPMIMKINPDMLPILMIAVDMDGMDSVEISDYVENELAPELESVEGVASVSTIGGVEETIRVTIDADKLAALNVKIQASIDDSLSEAQGEINDAKKELADGKKELADGKKELADGKEEAAGQIADGKKEIDDQSAELAKTKKTLEAQKASLQSTATTLNNNITLVQKVLTDQAVIEGMNTALNAQLEQPAFATMKPVLVAAMPSHEFASKADYVAAKGVLQSTYEASVAGLDYLKADYEAKESAYQAAEAALALDSTNTTLITDRDDKKTARDTAQASYAGAQGTISFYKALDQAIATYDELDSLETQIKKATGSNEYTNAQASLVLGNLQSGYAQVIYGIEQIDNGLAQISAGEMSLETAKSLIETNESLANYQMDQAEAKLNEAEESIKSGEEQLEDAQKQLDEGKEEAYKQADAANILSVETVEGILYAQNFNMPAGYVEEKGESYLIKVGDKVTTQEDLEKLVLLDLGMDGIDVITLGDVATVERVNNSEEVYAKVNGNDGIILSLEKQTGYSTGDVSDAVNARAAELMAQNEGLHLSNLMDQGVYIDYVVDSVVDNMLWGALLAVIVLLLFLKDFKPTIVIAISIPVSIIFAITLMYFSGISLNIISLSGLALGVGMLVDNSIVVIENIYRLRNEGYSPTRAAVAGAKQVSGAIAASTLTTICVFAPIVFTEGITRQLFTDMGLTIAYSLLASLIIALTMVPAISASLLTKTKEVKHPLLDRIGDFYCRFMDKALHFKPLIFIAALALLVISGLLSYSRGLTFIPDMESTQATITVNAPEEASFADVCELSDEIVARIEDLEDIETIGAMVGGTSSISLMSSGGDNTISMYVILKEDMSMSNKALKDEILRRTEDLDCEVEVSMEAMDLSALMGSGLSMYVTGRDLTTLQGIAEDMAEIVATVEGTENVDSGVGETTPVLQISIDKAKAAEYGMTVAQLYQLVYAEVADGSAATSISTDLKDYEVYVSTSEKEELTLEALQKISFTYTDKDGEEEDIYLEDLADFTYREGLSSINRSAQTRYLTVSADIADGYNVTQVSEKVVKALESYDFPEGYGYEMSGEDEYIYDAMKQVLLMLVVAVIFIYLIMVAQFQSLLSPFIIMFTIPLAFTGSFFALYFTGKEISIIAMVGFVLLAGIIVNNGIVMVDYINQLRLAGWGKRDAIVRAGRTRLRPILMTAMTTIFGLLTMAFGMGMGADLVQPMAIVAIGGLMYGTLLTLIVVPCIYDVFHRDKPMVDRLAGIDDADFEGTIDVEHM